MLGVKMKLPCLPIKGERAEKLVGCGDRWINLINSLSMLQKNHQVMKHIPQVRVVIQQSLQWDRSQVSLLYPQISM